MYFKELISPEMVPPAPAQQTKSKSISTSLNISSQPLLPASWSRLQELYNNVAPNKYFSANTLEVLSR